MAQFSAAIAACNSESKFAKAYSKGVKKTEYWEVGRLISSVVAPVDITFVGILKGINSHDISGP